MNDPLLFRTLPEPAVPKPLLGDRSEDATRETGKETANSSERGRI